MIVYYSPSTHRPSVSEREPQGWLMNWMTDRLVTYQFRELESIERFGKQIFWTNHFNERILDIQYSKRNCRSHHLSVSLYYDRNGRGRQLIVETSLTLWLGYLSITAEKKWQEMKNGETQWFYGAKWIKSGAS